MSWLQDNNGLPTKPTLPEPFWLANVDVTPQLMLGYQMKSSKKNDILKKDMAKLKAMNQPKLVKEQLAQLYTELEDHGDAINPLLEQDGTSTNLSSTTETSSSDDNDEKSARKKSQKQVWKMNISQETRIFNLFLGYF